MNILEEGNDFLTYLESGCSSIGRLILYDSFYIECILFLQLVYLQMTSSSQGEVSQFSMTFYTSAH